MWIVSLLILILILGIIILVHEFGHFIWAKKFGVHIYEFSIGMGPVIHTHKGKDKIDYNIRAFPIGGFVSMAGEVYEDANEKIKKEDYMCNKPWWQRVIILVAGVVNNFILAIVLLFLSSLIWGGSTLKPVVKNAVEGYPMAEAGITSGDTITAINGHKVSSWDVAQIILVMKNKNDYYTFEVKHEDGKTDTYKVVPKVEKDADGNERQVFGIEVESNTLSGFFGSIKYAFMKFNSIVQSMWLTITGLITGKISASALSGPVGMYKIVDDGVALGLNYMIYLTAFLSINVGFINILPFPAFDGGRVFFLIVEAIRRKPINAKFENACHLVGFALLMLLMIYITIQDIIRLF